MAVGSSGCSLQVEALEVDGTDAIPGDMSLPILTGIFVMSASQDINVTVTNSHIHDLETSDDDIGLTGIAVLGDQPGADTTVNITNTTINGLSTTGTGAQAAVTGIQVQTVNGALGLTAQIHNTTITDIVATQARAGGVTLLSLSDGAIVNADLVNSTLTNISGATGGLVDPAAIVLVGATNDATTLNLESTNTIIADVLGCAVANLNGLFGYSGTVNLNITSAGGNLTDDTSCSPYFTHPSDKNNIGSLASTLGALSNNGGFVPTIPLLAGSPAIDAGVAVAGLTTDARGAVRPQGLAFDGGAYESSFSRSTSPAASNSGGTLANTGNSVISILLAAISLLALGVGVLYRFQVQKP